MSSRWWYVGSVCKDPDCGGMIVPFDRYTDYYATPEDVAKNVQSFYGAHNINLKERYIMSTLSKVTDQLMGLTISELTQVQRSNTRSQNHESKVTLTVGANVFVVQKTKKTFVD